MNSPRRAPAEAVVVGDGRRMSGKPHRFVALDSLRGVCACLVALFHLHTTGTMTNLKLVTNGWIFVDFFFVLSGFVIAASYGERLRAGFPVREFMVLRLGRIYPLHLAMLLVFVAFELAALATGGGGTMARAAFTGSRTPAELVQSLLLVQIFGLAQGVSWNVPSWSIAAELWAYLIAALAARGLGRRLTGALVAAAVLAPIVLAWLPSHELDQTFDWSLLRCVYGFALGWLTFERWPRAAFPALLATMLEAATLVAVVVAVSLLPHGPAQFAYPPLFAVAVWVFAAERGAVGALLRRPAFRRLGDWSFSIYMIHYFLLGRMIDVATLGGRAIGVPLTRIGESAKVLTGPGITPDLLAVVGLAGVVLVSRFTFDYIEKPWRDASRRLAMRVGGRPAREEERVAPTI